MKLILSILLFICIPIKGISQPFIPDRIGYESSISFFVESDLHLKDEIIYYSNDVVWIKLPVLSSNIKMGFPIEGLIYSAFHKIDYHSGKEKKSFSEVDYKIEGEKKSKSEWIRLKIQPGYGIGYPLKYFIDTSFKDGDTLRVSFKRPGGEIFEVIEFEKKNIAPVIRLFRNVGDKDTTIKYFRTPIFKEQKYSEGFSRLNSNVIQTKATHSLELVFTNLSVSDDSSILYRLNTKSEKGQWIKTGHFALLRGLKTNRTYTFEVKYRGTDISNKYSITILPYWYQTNFVIVSFAAIALITLLVIWLIWQKIKLKTDRRKIELFQYKLKAIQSQLNPHFIFNALSSIQSLVNNDEKKLANKYLTNFSNVLRGALKNSEVIFLPLTTELELMRNYIEIEKLRFQFEYNFILDTTINMSEIEVPPMLFQPSIENAIKHGGGRKGETGIINIQINKKGNGFYVSIFDNGQWGKMTEGSGVGISLTKERIAAINNLNKERKIEFKIDTSTRGTIIYFNFYNWLT